MSSYVQRFDVVGLNGNAGEDGAIVVDAGWGTPASLQGSVLLKIINKLKNVRIQVEFRGYCETRWETMTKLATRQHQDNYKVTRSGRVFQQLVAVAYESPEPLMPNPVGGPLSFPFKIDLPKNNMPPSFDTVSGCISYYVKVTMLVQEGLKLLKSNYDVEKPVIVRMPEIAKQKLLDAPSTMLHESQGTDSKVGYTVSIPRRIVVIGETLEVDISITSIPPGTKLRVLSASLRSVSQYVSLENSNGAQAPVPRPLSEISQTFPLLTLTEAITRRLFLLVDPQLALASMESPLISVKTILRIEIVIDNSETPNISFELPIVVVPSLATKSSKVMERSALNVHSNFAQPFPPPMSSPMSLRSPPSSRRADDYIRAPNPNPRASGRSDSVKSMPEPPMMRQPSITSSTSSQNSISPPFGENRHSAAMRSRAAPIDPRFQPIIPGPGPGPAPAYSKYQPVTPIQNIDITNSPAENMFIPESPRHLSDSTFKHDNPDSLSISKLSISNKSSVNSFSASGPFPDESWSVAAVAEWVGQLGASRDICEAFIRNEIDGSILQSLSIDDLKNELGVDSFGLRRKIMMTIGQKRV